MDSDWGYSSSTPHPLIPNDSLNVCSTTGLLTIRMRRKVGAFYSRKKTTTTTKSLLTAGAQTSLSLTCSLLFCLRWPGAKLNLHSSSQTVTPLPSYPHPSLPFQRRHCISCALLTASPPSFLSLPFFSHYLELWICCFHNSNPPSVPWETLKYLT